MKNAHTIMPAVLLATVLNGFAADKEDGRTSPTFANVPYGEHERNVLDLWLPGGNKPASPAPLVVYIHGGGFGGGNKNAGGNQQQLVALCKDRGWIYAAINYRYAKKNGVTVLDSMSDGKRAVQFLRHNAEQWGIDPKRVALYGGSAGAGMCLWIGLQDDMADPGNADPVLRESTRVSCIGMINGQITYDRQEMISIIFKDMKLPPQFMVAKNGSNDSPGVSMLKYISANDPPVFAFSFWPDTPPQEGVHFGHHPRHGMEVKKRYDSLGLRCEILLVVNENVEKDDKAKSAGHAKMMNVFASVMTQKKP
jgi:pimeloyl-ACP methyl ester carboxylesterase